MSSGFGESNRKSAFASSRSKEIGRIVCPICSKEPMRKYKSGNDWVYKHTFLKRMPDGGKTFETIYHTVPIHREKK